jgi:type I restriction enzyme S subunit
MISDKQARKLGDVITLHRGYDLPAKERKEGCIPVISSSGVSGFHSEAKIQAPGVITGRYGTLGKVYYADRDFWPLNTTLYVSDFKGNDPRFIAYFLENMHLERYSGAAAVPGIDRNVLHLLDVEIPSLPTQKAISNILSAYDDLIENNTRRIRILEEMAQAIYREWFVNFRFPGHEGVRMVKSAMGAIPEGWQVKPILSSFDTLGGGTPSTKTAEYWENGDVIWFTPSDLTKAEMMFICDSEKKISVEGLQKSSAKLFPAYSVMMTSRATIGVTAINTQAACTNQGFIACIPNDRVSVYQIYFWIKDNFESINQVASGATYKEISRGEFRELLFPLSDAGTNKRFIEIVSPIGNLIENLIIKNSNLRNQRDMLLPRLINGELDVDSLALVGESEL